MTSLWDRDRREIDGVGIEDFRIVRRLQTRWRDNDANGHVNNAVYYEYFDTAINSWLLERLPTTPSRQTTRKYVAESACRYLNEIAYPAPILVGLNVATLGRSSVGYDLGIFAGADGTPGPLAALGRWVHVFVDAGTRRPTDIPDDFRAVYSQALVSLEKEAHA